MTGAAEIEHDAAHWSERAGGAEIHPPWTECVRYAPPPAARCARARVSPGRSGPRPRGLRVRPPPARGVEREPVGPGSRFCARAVGECSRRR
jgi:hypothetical protein